MRNNLARIKNRINLKRLKEQCQLGLFLEANKANESLLPSKVYRLVLTKLSLYLDRPETELRSQVTQYSCKDMYNLLKKAELI